MEIPLGNTSEQGSGQRVDWMPLLIVLGAVYLISIALVYGTLSFGGLWNVDYNLELKLSLILSFLAGTALIVTVALVIYQRTDQARKLLVVGMLMVILLLAIRTEVYLRAIW